MTASLETRFHQAAVATTTALRNKQEIERVAGHYDSAFENPYEEDCADSDRILTKALQAFGPLVREAIEAGHHERWIQHRLPSFMTTCIHENHEYGVTVKSPLGVCCDVPLISSGISDRDRYVQWTD